MGPRERARVSLRPEQEPRPPWHEALRPLVEPFSVALSVSTLPGTLFNLGLLSLLLFKERFCLPKKSEG